MENEIHLSDKKLVLDGTTYHIHGLIHGTTFVRIKSSLKKEISNQLQRLEVICEDGFASWIKGSESMNETEYFKLNKFSLLDITRFWSFFIFSNLFKKKKEPEILNKVREMKSIEDMNKIREELFKKYPSEPEGMNSLMKKRNCGTISSPKGDVPLSVKRYIYEAKFALDYVNKNNLNDLHIVVGCAHELPLEYLLQNKKVLEEYKS